MSTSPAKLWKGLLDGPGLYLGVPDSVYHADPCPAPSLSSHIGRIALALSVRHAQAAHPRFEEPEKEDEEDDEDAPAPARHLLIGSAAHSLMLGAGADVIEMHVKNFKTKAAREERRAHLDAGSIPLKRKDYRVAQRMAEIARPIWLDQFGGRCIPEAMLVWQERGLWRRGLMDGVSPDLRVAGDYKTSGRRCPPAVAAKFVNSNGYPFQERFYGRGLDALDPEGLGRRRFFFMFQEVEYPHGVAVVETDEANRTMADEQVAAACAIWDRALVTGEWPSYSLEPHVATPQPWDLSQWDQRAMTDEILNPLETIP